MHRRQHVQKQNTPEWPDACQRYVCSVCVDDCPGFAESGKSAFRASRKLCIHNLAGVIAAGADEGNIL